MNLNHLEAVFKEFEPRFKLKPWLKFCYVVNLERIERIENKRGRDRALLNQNQTKELSAYRTFEEIDTLIFLLGGQCSSPAFIQNINS